MNTTQTFPSPEGLSTLSEVLKQVGRVHRLSHEDHEDFIQSVHLKLIEDDYDVFRQFEGRSSLRTYLVVVCTRLLLDWQGQRYGRWRPSAAAVRLGEAAIELERLVHRDGHTMPNAIELISTRNQALTVPELERIAAQLPPRTRRRLVSDRALDNVSAESAGDPVEVRQNAATACRIAKIVERVLSTLSTEERLLIEGRYLEGRSVPSLARTLGAQSAPLYRRCERLLRSLRRALTDAGVTNATTIEPLPRQSFSPDHAGVG